MVNRIFLLLFLCFTMGVYGQKLDKQTRNYLKAKLDTLKGLDQKYRWQLTFWETDTKRIDSLRKLSPEEIILWTTIKKERITPDQIKVLDSLDKLQERLDSLNAISLLKIIEKYGYPSYKRTGSRVTTLLILHLTGEWYYQYLTPLFFVELQKGTMPPDEFARWFDRNQLMMKKKQLYGEYNNQFPCVEDLAKTNIERKKIGLKPLKKNKCN